MVDDAIVMLENIMRHVEDGEPPFQAALRGSREVGFTIISISSSLIAVFIPIFFMPGVIGLLFHEFAVVVGAGHRRLGLRLADAGADAGQPLPHATRRTRSRPGALVRSFERGFDALLAGYTRALDVALRHRGVVLRGRAGRPSLATVLAVRRHPQGLLPARKTSARSASRTEAAEDTSFPAMVQLQERVAAIIRADPNVATVNSFNGGGGAQNTGRLFINLKPRGERQPMKEVVEGLRRKLREVPGIAVFMQPIQNLQLGGRPSKAQYQYILQSVQRRRAQRLGAASCRSRCAPTRCSATSPATRSCAACRPR